MKNIDFPIETRIQGFLWSHCQVFSWGQGRSGIPTGWQRWTGIS